MTADLAAIVPVPPRGCVLLVAPTNDPGRVGFVMISVEQLCRSPDDSWAALRWAWLRLAEQQRQAAGR